MPQIWGVRRIDGENEMTFLGVPDIPTRDIDYFREALRVREAELADAKKRRDTILSDIRKTCAAVDAGDQRARLELKGLNKQNVETGRLVLSIEASVAEARKRVNMAQAQADAARAKAAVPVAEGADVLCVEFLSGWRCIFCRALGIGAGNQLANSKDYEQAIKNFDASYADMVAKIWYWPNSATRHVKTGHLPATFP
jgi:hypothetical protein